MTGTKSKCPPTKSNELYYDIQFTWTSEYVIHIIMFETEWIGTPVISEIYN